MNFPDIYTNLLQTPILFFLLGTLITLFKVNLIIPDSISKFLSLYLLCCLGFNGGVELTHAGINQTSLVPLGAALLLALIVPLYIFFALRKKFTIHNAAGIAASYGSVGAVTFITAANMLEIETIPFGGYMIAALALMEAPSIIISITLANRYTKENKNSFLHLIHESFFNSSVFLILGSLIIGALVTPHEATTLKPFTQSIFRGFLCLFMLDVGIFAAQKLHDLKKNALVLVPLALLFPSLNAVLAIGLSHLLMLSVGDSFLLTALSASASYIAVPAALRTAMPQANPSLYIPMALGITFPFNILVGLPLYLSIIQYFWAQ